MKKIKNLQIKNETTVDELDYFFESMWLDRKKEEANNNILLRIDLSNCSNLTLNRILSIKGVMNKHRESSKQFIDESKIYVSSRMYKNLIKLGLFIIKTERPVHVVYQPN